MAATMDLSTNPDLMRMESLQMQQTELTEFFILITESISKLTNWGDKRVEEKQAPDLPRESRKFGDQTYLSLVDLDNPAYAQTILVNESYIPSKNVIVNMSRFDGSMQMKIT